MKAQFSLEFILTYAWAMLIVLGAVGAIYATGVLNFEQFLPQRCQFYGQVVCQEFSSSATQSSVSVNLINDFGVDLVVHSMNVTDDTNLGCQFETPNKPWLASTPTVFNLTSCVGDAFVKGNRINGALSVVFFRESLTCTELTPSCHHTAYAEFKVVVD